MVNCNIGPLPKLPCASFSRLTSLRPETEWNEPADSFHYLSQLHSLEHMYLETAAPADFGFSALTALSCLQIFNYTAANIEALQVSPDLQCVEFSNFPQDEHFDHLSKLTQLTRLAFDADGGATEPSTCHLSAVMKLCSLTGLIELRCVLVMDGDRYSVRTTGQEALVGDADFLVSVTDPEAFGLILTPHG